LKLTLKRIFDFLFSVLTLCLFFWILLIAWIIAVIDTRTNGIFIQERIGRYGKRFRIYKLRTIQRIHDSGEFQISRMGRVLRNFKLDELPQLFNVLKGEMSIVGPRPDISGYYDLLEGENRKILELKPGLTSLASLKYYNEDQLLEKQSSPLVYNDQVLFSDKVQLNLEYYYHQSFCGDIKIIIKTVGFVFFKTPFDKY
jgi:lipopolysaccharide/colanic/teichoic acid biosynthesis glycosyltransferase